MSRVQISRRISVVRPCWKKAGRTAEARQTFKSRDISVGNGLYCDAQWPCTSLFAQSPAVFEKPRRIIYVISTTIKHTFFCLSNGFYAVSSSHSLALLLDVGLLLLRQLHRLLQLCLGIQKKRTEHGEKKDRTRWKKDGKEIRESTVFLQISRKRKPFKLIPPSWFQRHSPWCWATCPFRRET